jgi:hypothetical protein
MIAFGNKGFEVKKYFLIKAFSQKYVLLNLRLKKIKKYIFRVFYQTY